MTVLDGNAPSFAFSFACLLKIWLECESKRLLTPEQKNKVSVEYILMQVGLDLDQNFTSTRQLYAVQPFGPDHQDIMLAAHIHTSKADICTKLWLSHLHHVIISWLPHQEVEEMEVVSQPTRLLNWDCNDWNKTRWSFHPRYICANQNQLFVTGSWSSKSVIVTTETDIFDLTQDIFQTVTMWFLCQHKERVSFNLPYLWFCRNVLSCLLSLEVSYL